MRKITVIHPSRGRASLAYKAYSEWKSKANNWFGYVLSIEPDQEADYRRYFTKEKILVSQNKTAIEAINTAAGKIEFDILVVMSDDFSCQQGWDDKIRQAVGDKNNFVLKTFDGTQGWIVTLPIMDRAYYNSYGYVYYPEYKHLFCDTELTTVAEYTGKLITRNDLVFPHNTHVTGNDHINNKNNSTWQQGEDLYLKRYRSNFGVMKQKEISSMAHLNWIKGKL